MSEQSLVEVEVVALPHYQGLDLPSYATAASAGMDLRSAEEGTVVLGSLERRAIRTGISIALPVGYEAQIRPRSGLALKEGVGMVNGPGTIDADYRGELMVLLINLGREPVHIERGQRIAQMIVAPVARVAWRPVSKLAESGRGEGGFGHTGKV